MTKWKRVKIGDFLTERQERFKPDDERIQKYQRLDKINFSGTIHLSNKATKTNMILVYPDDLVISGINVSKGALAVYKGNSPVTATIHYSSYTFDDSIIDLDFFKWFVKSPAFIEVLKNQVKGGIKTEIKASTFLKLEISIPETVEEQKNIVKNLVSQIEKVETTQDEIAEQKALIKKLRQSILQDAIEGKLTENWRKENLDGGSFPLAPAGKPSSATPSAGDAPATPPKSRGDKKMLAPITDEEKPFELPKSWKWVRLGEIIYETPKNGYSPKAVNYETKTKSLKLGAITWAKFDGTEIKYIDEILPADSPYWLKNGDFLLQRSNSIDYVGICAIYTGKDNEYMYPDLMMRFRPIKNLNHDFIHKAIIAPFNREYFKKNAKGSQQTMPKINQECVVNTLIPLPPLAEQNEIVRRVENQLDKVEQLEQQVQERETLTKSLFRGILKNAFEGR